MQRTESNREITFIGAGDSSVKPAQDSVRFAWIETLDQLFYYLLKFGWGENTVSPRMREIYDHANNPSKGNCSITAALVQDIFGGDLIRVEPLPGTTHSINRINDKYYDLTSDQFTIDGHDINLDSAIEIEREDCLRDMSVVARYNQLCIKLCTALGKELATKNSGKLTRRGLPLYEKGRDIKSYLDLLKQSLHDNEPFSDEDYFSTFGDRDTLAEQIKNAESAEVAMPLLGRYCIAQTIVKSSAVAGQPNPRQYIINDSIYKHSELVCKKERDILLELIDNIKNKL